MKANKQTGLHLDQLLSQTVLKGEGQHNRAAGYKAKQKHTQKKKKKFTAIWERAVVMSRIRLWRGRGVSPGFLQGWCAGSVADRGAVWSDQTGVLVLFFFFLKALILHSGSESHPSLRRQFRRGGRKKFLATGEGRGGSNSLLLCVVQTVGVEKTSVSYCTVGRKSRARRVTGSLMAAESRYMSVEAEFCCVAQC